MQHSLMNDNRDLCLKMCFHSNDTPTHLRMSKLLFKTGIICVITCTVSSNIMFVDDHELEPIAPHD